MSLDNPSTSSHFLTLALEESIEYANDLPARLLTQRNNALKSLAAKHRSNVLLLKLDHTSRLAQFKETLAKEVSAQSALHSQERIDLTQNLNAEHSAKKAEARAQVGLRRRQLAGLE